MSYFDELLAKRGEEVCPLPLWNLKISDEEYKELKTQLRLLALRNNASGSNPFVCRARECALFYAEYWRREYYDGAHSKQAVYKTLGLPQNIENSAHLYQSALRGARSLKIELYSDEGRTQWVDSMFYQGGLPMKCVTEGKKNSNWDNFVRGLVRRNVNFDELNLGVVASNNHSLQEFCDKIIAALDAKQFNLMPFYCENELNSWYTYLQELKEEESHRQRLSHPFSLDWEFRIDTIEKKISIKYVAAGRSRLPQSFIDDNNIANPNFFSIYVNVNGKVIDTFDYEHNFCRYEVISKHTYHMGDSVSIHIDGDATPVIAEDLDMSVPHILYKNNDGKYELGNRIGKQESFLLIPEGWKLEDSHGLCIDHYDYEGTVYEGVKVPVDVEQDLTVKSSDGILTFGCNTPLYWTELISKPAETPNIVETLYDASTARFSLCNDMEDGVRTQRNVRVEYRCKRDNEWKTEPCYGEIFARAIKGNGEFVTPVKFVNIGKGVNVNVISADEQTCKIQVAWEHGRVSSTEGIKCVSDNDVWEVNKKDITNNKIRFTLIPKDNSNSQFDIQVKAPFKEFAILDNDDKAISSDCWIPYCDVDRYQYHLVGQDIREYTYGKHCRQLKWIEEKLYIKEDGKVLKSIPYEGSLLLLLGSREELRQLLGRTSQNMLDAEVAVCFRTEDEQKLSFAIKDSPFRPKQEEDGKVVITSMDKKVIDFRERLKLLKLDEPLRESVTLRYNAETGYILPEELRSWGKTLLVGRSRGRICPALVDLTREMNGIARRVNREEAIQYITEKLKVSYIGDKLWQRIIGWFCRTQAEDIPASSLLELLCVARNPSALICLAFQLFAQCNNEEDSETLLEQLKSFSADLAFSWYWLIPHLECTMSIISGYTNDLNNEVIRTMYLKWAMRQGEKAIEYLAKLSNKEEYEDAIVQCIGDTLTLFVTWMKKLCVDSLVETYDYQTDESVTDVAKDIVENYKNLCRIDDGDYGYIDVNQDYINEATENFFEKYSEGEKTDNETWMWKRVKAVAAHIYQKEDLFAETDEIRRSIIFCQKSCNKQFVILLNNKLKNYEIC